MTFAWPPLRLSFKLNPLPGIKRIGISRLGTGEGVAQGERGIARLAA